MTKVRPPMTFARALARIAGHIGWDGCATVLGKSESFVRKLSDPDTEREISLQDARRLDLAYQRAEGAGAPFLEAYARQVEAESAEPTTTAEIAAAAKICAKETGEAVGALIATIEHGGSLRVRQEALREIEEAMDALRDAASKIAGIGKGESAG